jgi:hypothetical protein
MIVNDWEARADAAAIDDEDFDIDAPWLDPEGDREAQLERAVYRELARAGVPEPLSSEDRRRAEQTLAEFYRRRPRQGRRAWPAVLGGALAIAAAVVLAWIILPERDLARPSGTDAVVTSGSLMLDEAVLGPEAAVPPDRWVVARKPSCVRLGGGTSCVGSSARLRAHAQTVEVAEGTLLFTGSGSVLTTFGSMMVEEGSFRVEVSSSSLALEVESGTVVVDSDGQVITVLEGERRTFDAEPHDVPETIEGSPGDIVEDDPGLREGSTADDVDLAAPVRKGSTRQVETTAGALLAAARNHVAQGKHDRALSTYASLQRRHSQSPEAHAAHVSIGELQLSRRRPAAALRAFDRYLARGGGPLAEEAHWGRIRALHKLGRLEQRDDAIEVLRSKHPRSVYLGQAARLP